MQMQEPSRGDMVRVSFVSPAAGREQFLTANAAVSQSVIKFRNFELWPMARLLVRSGEAVSIGSRAFDLLNVLLRSRGSVVPKSEMLRAVWPSTIVDESNLRFQIATLRNVLGNDRDLIKSIPGRGYLFACDPVFVRQSERGRAREKHSQSIKLPPRVETFLHSADAPRSPVLDQSLNAMPQDEEISKVFRHLLHTLVTTYGSLEAACQALSEQKP